MGFNLGDRPGRALTYEQIAELQAAVAGRPAPAPANDPVRRLSMWLNAMDWGHIDPEDIKAVDLEEGRILARLRNYSSGAMEDLELDIPAGETREHFAAAFIDYAETTNRPVLAARLRVQRRRASTAKPPETTTQPQTETAQVSTTPDKNEREIALKTHEITAAIVKKHEKKGGRWQVVLEDGEPQTTTLRVVDGSIKDDSGDGLDDYYADAEWTPLPASAQQPARVEKKSLSDSAKDFGVNVAYRTAALQLTKRTRGLLADALTQHIKGKARAAKRQIVLDLLDGPMGGPLVAVLLSGVLPQAAGLIGQNAAKMDRLADELRLHAGVSVASDLVDGLFGLLGPAREVLTQALSGLPDVAPLQEGSRGGVVLDLDRAGAAVRG